MPIHLFGTVPGSTHAPYIDGRYPNKPDGLTGSTTIDFSQPIPAGTAGTDRPIPGTDFNIIYDRVPTDPEGALTATTDTLAPRSPSGIWRYKFLAGTHGDPASGWGIGNIYTSIETANATRLYVSLWVKLDPNYYYHTISNKWFNIESTDINETRLNILVQLFESGNYLQCEEKAGPQWGPPPDINTPIPLGVWHQVEVDINIPGGTFRLWLNGVKRTNGSLTFVATHIRAFGIYGFRGGGGECAACSAPVMPRDAWYDVDDLHLAWA